MYYVKINSGVIDGFYIEDLHGEQVCNTVYLMGGLKVEEELYQHLLSLGQAEFIGSKEEKIYTILDKDLFKKVIQPLDPTPPQPSQLELLKEEVLQQSESMVDMDFRLTSLELGL